MNNFSASVIARLKNYSRASALDFNLVSRLYMQEGLLKRIHAEVIPFEVVMRTISEQLKPIYQQLLQEAEDHPE